MADLSTKGLQQILADQAAAAQASAGQALDFSVGSILRALAEATGAVALWLQAMILKVLAMTRLATSTGDDADSFVVDFGMTRLPAAFAQGEVTLSRFTPTAAAFVPVGALVRTADGSASYVVTTGGTGYDSDAGGYTIPAGTASLTVPVIAVTQGTSTNVAAGTVSLLASAISGVDTVVNQAAISGGAPAETDAAMRARFVAYLASLSKATRAAIGYTVSQVQSGLTYNIIEGEDAAGLERQAHFTVVVDDGTGAPSQALLNRVGDAVEAVRGLGISFEVVAVSPVAANVSLSITTATGASHVVSVATVADAIESYIDSLGIGQTLSYLRLAQVAFAADPNVTAISGLLLNGSTSDLAVTSRQVARAGTVAVG
ncbi:baseplate J/gp47 family protein [Roseomonas mucosa]|uniref:baseplate J/gp47 family protein n=1 Tax=Roseomonas mucosa TaxID=207340 RepID=UPI00224803AA|nr:baseplate J/gp47 family protein [Roseomonas mucosa]UZO91777.1 Hypothetical protein RMP42_05982 [Roseomonas mucosa]